MGRPCTQHNTGRASINNNGTLVFILAVFYVFTYTLTQTHISTEAPIAGQTPNFIFAFAFALEPLKKYTNKNLQRVTKLASVIFVKCQEDS